MNAHWISVTEKNMSANYGADPLTAFSDHLLSAATKLGQGNIFTSVCLSTGGRGVCLSACWDTHSTTPPPSRHPTPPDQAPPLPDPLPDQAPPGADTPPPREADCSIRLTSGRYASYWNAFLFLLLLV